MVIMNLEVGLAISSLEGISTGTRQGGGVGDVLVILDLDLEVISLEGTSTRCGLSHEKFVGN